MRIGDMVRMFLPGLRAYNLYVLCFDRFLWLKAFLASPVLHLQVHNLRPFHKRYFHNACEAFLSCANSSGFVFTVLQ